MNNRFLKTATTFALPIIIVGAGFILNAWIWSSLTQGIQNENALQFESETDQITSIVQERMNLYTNVLYGTQGLFNASQEVKADEWSSYVKGLAIPENYSGISTMIFIRRVPASKLSTFPYPIYPAATKSDYYPIDYTVQTNPSDAATPGFDVSSEEQRNQAIMRAAQSGRLSATGVVTGAASKMPVFLVYAPIYRGGFPATAAERSKALVGFTAATFRIKELFAVIASDPAFQSAIDVRIYDASTTTAATSENLLFDTSSSTAKNGSASSLTREATVMVGGRTWTLVFTARPGYHVNAISSLLPWLILASGLSFSVLLGFIIYILNTLRERAQSIAARATRELSLSKQDLQNFFDGLSTIMLKISTEGKVLFANQATKQASGLGEKFIGADYLSGPWFSFDSETAERAKENFKAALAGRSTTAEEQIRVRTSVGERIVPINFSLVPVIQNGSVQYVVAEARDISVSKKIEEEILQKNADLERLNKLMVDRELKMAELKEEIRHTTHTTQ